MHSSGLLLFFSCFPNAFSSSFIRSLIPPGSICAALYDAHILLLPGVGVDEINVCECDGTRESERLMCPRQIRKTLLCSLSSCVGACVSNSPIKARKCPSLSIYPSIYQNHTTTMQASEILIFSTKSLSFKRSHRARSGRPLRQIIVQFPQEFSDSALSS